MIRARTWTRYVAIGDSFTEGMCDPDPESPDSYIGWADRLAAALGDRAHADGADFGYANLAIRGRLLADVADRQLPLALKLEPDLVSIVGGGNDILRPRADVDALADRLEGAVSRIRATGADVLLATPTDPREAPLLKYVRGRHAVYTAHIWTIARRHGCAVIDQWGMEVLRDWRMWSEDRIHMSPAGHARVAAAALAALGNGEQDGDWAVSPAGKQVVGRLEQLRADREWAVRHLRPWVQRRLTGRSSGDHRAAKRPDVLTPRQLPAHDGRHS